jgi:hypothetical protein
LTVTDTARQQHMTQVLHDYIGVWIGAFITAKRAGGMTRNTIDFYSRKRRWCMKI